LKFEDLVLQKVVISQLLLFQHTWCVLVRGGLIDVIQQMDKVLCRIKNFTFVPCFDNSTDAGGGGGQDNEGYILRAMQLEQSSIVFTSNLHLFMSHSLMCRFRC
jgi:hypothetical protein